MSKITSERRYHVSANIHPGLDVTFVVIRAMHFRPRSFYLSSTRVGVHLSLAAGEGDVDKAADVLNALLRATLGGLLLLLRLDLCDVANQRPVQDLVFFLFDLP
jgi:hypothetical protein